MDKEKNNFEKAQTIASLTIVSAGVGALVNHFFEEKNDAVKLITALGIMGALATSSGMKVDWNKEEEELVITGENVLCTIYVDFTGKDKKEKEKKEDKKLCQECKSSTVKYTYRCKCFDGRKFRYCDVCYRKHVRERRTRMQPDRAVHMGPKRFYCKTCFERV